MKKLFFVNMVVLSMTGFPVYSQIFEQNPPIFSVIYQDKIVINQELENKKLNPIDIYTNNVVVTDADGRKVTITEQRIGDIKWYDQDNNVYYTIRDASFFFHEFPDIGKYVLGVEGEQYFDKVSPVHISLSISIVSEDGTELTSSSITFKPVCGEDGLDTNITPSADMPYHLYDSAFIKITTRGAAVPQASPC